MARATVADPGRTDITRRGPFAPKQLFQARDFSLGKNDKFSPLLIDVKELVDIQNFHYDQKGTLQKRKGFVKRYAANFNSTPVKGLFNYRKENGNSYLVSVSNGSFYYELNNSGTTTNFANAYTASARWQFATENDILYGVDGVDAPIKWDGTTFSAMPGSPPITQYVIVHKNRMFMAGNPTTNRSRIYFSNLGDPETWPALNFIDVGKGDGDSITGLAILNDQLVITKDHSIWLLQGDAPTNFVLRRATSEYGCVTGFSFGIVGNQLFMISSGGVVAFDGIKAVLVSEKIINTFAGANAAQLIKAAAVVYRSAGVQKYWLALPEGASTTNNFVLMYDGLRTAWSVYRGPLAGELVVLQSTTAADVLVIGSATVGMDYNAETGYNDDGAAIDAFFVTQAMTLGLPDELKIVRRVVIDGAEATGGTATATVSFFKDLGSESNPVTITLTGTFAALRALPGMVGIGTLHSLSVKVRHNTNNVGVTIWGVLVEHIRKGVRATGFA